MLIPEDKINDVRSMADIVDVVSDYVSLKPSGKHFKGLSPFTTEKTPSFIVSPDKQIYKCFSSGKGGNVFTFIMEMERVTFVDAVRLLAKRYNIPIEAATPKAAEEKTEFDKFYDALTFAARFFHTSLNSPEGKIATKYFLDRGLKLETISHFGLGYSPDTWNALHDAAIEAGHDDETLAALGLIKLTTAGDKYYDMFRGRAMFPIFSPSGKVLGFGGRIMTDDKEAPKYINSPESKVYDKSRILYAMNFAKDEIRRKDEVILVEGYMDAISLHEAGITNAVASSGTSLTVQQVQLIGRYTKNVLFIYDGDKAGIKAMMRGIDIILAEGLNPNVVSLPDDHDPDSYVRLVGADEFRKYVSLNKISFLDFKLNVLKAEGSFDTPDKATAAARILLESVMRISDKLKQEFYLRQVAEKIGIGLGTLSDELVALVQKQKPKPTRERPQPTQREWSQQEPTHQPDVPIEQYDAELRGTDSLQASQEPEQFTVAERDLLKGLMDSTYHGFTMIEFVGELSEKFAFKFETQLGQSVFNFLRTRYQNFMDGQSAERHFDIAHELTYIADDEQRNAVSALLIDDPVSEHWQRETASEYAKRCIMAVAEAAEKIVFAQVERDLHENLAQLAATAKFPEAQDKLMKHRAELLNHKKELKTKFDDLIGREVPLDSRL
jgi:DNA primase